MKRYLVLGAGGFIGRALCKELAKNNYVRALDYREIPEFNNIVNIDVVTGNFTNILDFSGLLKDIDVVFHLISTTIPSDDTSKIDAEIRDNIIPTVRLLESMKNNNVKDIIFASSAGTVYGETGNHLNHIDDMLNPISSYGVQKMVIESYIKFYGRIYDIRYKIARISNPYGVGQDPSKLQGVIPIFINRLMSGSEIMVYGDGESKRDYIYLDDLIEGLLHLVDYEVEHCILNIGSGETSTLNEIIDVIEKTVQKKYSAVKYVPKRQHDVTKTILNVQETFDALQWTPKIKMKEGIKLIYDQIKL